MGTKVKPRHVEFTPEDFAEAAEPGVAVDDHDWAHEVAVEGGEHRIVGVPKPKNEQAEQPK